jgi:cytochrome c biogenesis protein
MPTQTKRPVKTARPWEQQARRAKKFKKNTLSPGQRFVSRLRYVARHPVDAAWGWLSSVRTAILLIVCIVVICFIGIYFIQAPGEVLSDPAAYAAWVQQNALPRYGSLTPIFDWLQFFKVFSSWYFFLVLTILALSIVVCTLNRAPAIWQNFRHPVIRRSDKFYSNALERSTFEHPDAVAWTSEALRKRHYRVRSVIVNSQGQEGKGKSVTYLYANKNSWATLSTFVFHAALVTLLFAGMISQWHGFAPDSPARRFLPAPLVALSDNLAGFTFDQALPAGQSAVVYPRGTPHNISFRVNSFKAIFDPKTGLPTDYVTDLSVYQDGVLVAHSDHLRVNDPLSYNGVVFHQSSLIPSVTLTVSDAQGCLVCSQAIVLDHTATLDASHVVDYAEGIAIADSNLTMSVLFPHLTSLQLGQVKNPVFLVSIGVPGTSQEQLKFLQRLAVGQTRQSLDKQLTVTVNSASEATVLLVTKDAGGPLVWPTSIFLILSLCVTFYFPQRRIWLRIEGERVQAAALREHFTNIRSDLLGLERDAKQSSDH